MVAPIWRAAVHWQSASGLLSKGSANLDSESLWSWGTAESIRLRLRTHMSGIMSSGLKPQLPSPARGLRLLRVTLSGAVLGPPNPAAGGGLGTGPDGGGDSNAISRPVGGRGSQTRSRLILLEFFHNARQRRAVQGTAGQPLSNCQAT